MAKPSRLANVSDAELANMTAKEIGEKYYNGNTGAGYNAAIARGVKPRAATPSDKPVTPAAKPAETAKPATPAPAKPEATPIILPLPGRVEAFFEYKMGWNMMLPIQPHHIEILIRCDDVSWNQLAMKFGPEEIAMLSAFLESGGFCPVVRISQRGQWFAEQKKLAEQRKLAESIAAIAAIDTRLASQRERFEASRYDAAIAAFYAD